MYWGIFEILANPTNFGVIIQALLTYLQILCFMLALNMLRLTIVVSEIRLRRKRFKFVLSPLTINLQMFLLSRFLLLHLLPFDSSFSRSSTLSLRGYIIEYTYIENIIVIFLYCNHHHYYCILPYTYKQKRFANQQIKPPNYS